MITTNDGVADHKFMVCVSLKQKLLLASKENYCFHIFCMEESDFAFWGNHGKKAEN
jgi:hypothetical protein